MGEFVVMSFFYEDSSKLGIINDGYVSSQLYKCLWIRGFSGFSSEILVALFSCRISFGQLYFPVLGAGLTFELWQHLTINI